jgi:hypothetical protein
MTVSNLSLIADLHLSKVPARSALNLLDDDLIRAVVGGRLRNTLGLLVAPVMGRSRRPIQASRASAQAGRRWAFHAGVMLRRLLAGAAAFFALVSYSMEAEAEIMLKSFALSPDGRLVAFYYSSEKGGKVGLFEWATGKLTPVPLPPDATAMRDPSFSTDGTKLTVLVPTGIAIIDLANSQATIFKVDPPVRDAPIFQAGDKAVLYVASGGGMWKHLRLLNLETGEETIVLEADHGFYSILYPSFIGRELVLFAGIGPQNADMAAAVEKTGVSKITGSVPYRLEFGGTPEIVFPDLIARNRVLNSSDGGGPTSFAASRNGERIVFIDRSLSEEERVKKERAGYYRYDLFMIEQGATSQLTKVEAYLAHQAISYDGSTAAFGVYAKPMTEFRYEPRGTRPFDLSIVDLRTRVVTPTHLLALLKSDPRFQ